MSVTSFSQLDMLSTQYMNNQFSVNPGYAGVRNSLAINLSARHQWMGIQGAPINYSLSAHSPINDSKASVGASLTSYSAGPIQISRFNGVYAYLVRLNHNIFLSLGASVGVDYFSFDRNNFV